MKRFFIISLIAAALIYGKDNREIITRAGVVTEINQEADEVIFVTTDGNEWSFEGVEDWLIDDELIVTFKSAGDPATDEIIHADYFRSDMLENLKED